MKKTIIGIVLGIIAITGGYLGLRSDDKCKNAEVQIHIVEDQFFCGTETEANAFRTQLIQELPLFKNKLETYEAMIEKDDEFYNLIKVELKNDFTDNLLELHIQAYKTRLDYKTYVKQMLIAEINTPKPDGDYDFDINRRQLVIAVMAEEIGKNKKLPKTKDEYLSLLNP